MPIIPKGPKSDLVSSGHPEFLACASTYLNVNIVLVNVCEDAVLAVVSVVAPYFAVLVSPSPLLGMFVVVPITLPFVIVPVIVIVVPVTCSFDSLHLVVWLEGMRRIAALLQDVKRGRSDERYKNADCCLLPHL